MEQLADGIGVPFWTPQELQESVSASRDAKFTNNRFQVLEIHECSLAQNGLGILWGFAFKVTDIENQLILTHGVCFMGGLSDLFNNRRRLPSSS